MTATITVNGTAEKLSFSPGATLLEVLRAAGHTEVKSGCTHGECGSCLVLLDGVLVNSCQVYAATAAERSITTSVGLAESAKSAPILSAFAETGAVQCGYCTPGMVMATHWLLSHNDTPTDAEIADGLMGNLCRCTGYVKIIDAVRLAAERMRDNG